MSENNNPTFSISYNDSQKSISYNGREGQRAGFPIFYQRHIVCFWAIDCMVKLKYNFDMPSQQKWHAYLV